MRASLEALIGQRCDSLTACTCGANCPVGPAAIAPRLTGPSPHPTAAVPPNVPGRRRWLGIVPLAVIACLACFLPALLAGGAAVAAVPLVRALDAPADLTLALGGAALGAAAAGAFLTFRHRGGVSC